MESSNTPETSAARVARLLNEWKATHPQPLTSPAAGRLWVRAFNEYKAIVVKAEQSE